MREFPFLINCDALQGKQFVSVDKLADASGAQAVQAFKLDVGGEDMYGMIAVSDWDEEIKDVSFIFLIPLWASLFLVPVSKPLVTVCLPVLVGFFKASCIHLALCQSLSLLAEYFQLLVVVTANLFMLLSNSCQPSGDVEEFFLFRGTVAFESSAHGSRREL